MKALIYPLDEILTSRAKLRLCRLGWESREALSAREMARRIGMVKRTVDLALGELMALGIMRRDGSAGTAPVRINKDHPLVAGALRLLFESEHAFVEVEFEAIRTLIEESWVGRAMSLEWAGLFGSMARGEATHDSDIDVAIIIESDASVPLVHDAASQSAETFTRRYGRQLSPLVLSKARFTRMVKDRDPLAMSMIRDGRRLAGPVRELEQLAND